MKTRSQTLSVHVNWSSRRLSMISVTARTRAHSRSRTTRSGRTSPSNIKSTPRPLAVAPPGETPSSQGVLPEASLSASAPISSPRSLSAQVTASTSSTRKRSAQDEVALGGDVKKPSPSSGAQSTATPPKRVARAHRFRNTRRLSSRPVHKSSIVAETARLDDEGKARTGDPEPGKQASTSTRKKTARQGQQGIIMGTALVLTPDGTGAPVPSKEQPHLDELKRESQDESTPGEIQEIGSMVPPPPALYNWTGHSTVFNTFATAWISNLNNYRQGWSGLLLPPDQYKRLDVPLRALAEETNNNNMMVLALSPVNHSRWPLPSTGRGASQYDACELWSGDQGFYSGTPTSPVFTWLKTPGLDDGSHPEERPKKRICAESCRQPPALGHRVDQESEVNTKLLAVPDAPHLLPVQSAAEALVSAAASASATTPLASTLPWTSIPIIQTIHGPAMLLESPPSAAPRLSEAQESVAPAATVEARRFVRWSPEEDQILLTAVEHYSSQGVLVRWDKIAREHFAGTRSGRQCKSHWKKVLDPSLKRTPWTAPEDEQILRWRKEGYSWLYMAHRLPGRSGEQVRDRFQQYLDPRIHRGPWTRQEMSILLSAQLRLGNKWAAMMQLLPGRTQNQIKNRWYNYRMTQCRLLKRAGRPTAAAAWRGRKGGTTPWRGGLDGGSPPREAVTRVPSGAGAAAISAVHPGGTISLLDRPASGAATAAAVNQGGTISLLAPEAVMTRVPSGAAAVSSSAI